MKNDTRNNKLNEEPYHRVGFIPFLIILASISSNDTENYLSHYHKRAAVLMMTI